VNFKYPVELTGVTFFRSHYFVLHGGCPTCLAGSAILGNQSVTAVTPEVQLTGERLALS
jgi:hypothetical protein